MLYSQDVFVCLFVNNSIDNIDALLSKNIYGFGKWVYEFENDSIKCMTNCINIVSRPVWFICGKSILLCTVVTLHPIYIYLVIFFFNFCI